MVYTLGGVYAGYPSCTMVVYMQGTPPVPWWVLYTLVYMPTLPPWVHSIPPAHPTVPHRR